MKLIIHACFAIGLFTISIGDFMAEAQQTSDDVVSQRALDDMRKTGQMVNKPVKAQQMDVVDEQNTAKEMTIEVQPGIIEMPGGEASKKVAKVNIKRTRIRNTELRNLNDQYNAVSIERIYAVASVSNVSGRNLSEQLKTKAKKKKKLEGKRILRKKGREFFESQDGTGKISADKHIKLKEKKKLKAKRRRQSEASALPQSQDVVDAENINVVSDMFIIEFKDYKDENGKTVTVDLDKAVSAYSALNVVVSAIKN